MNDNNILQPRRARPLLSIVASSAAQGPPRPLSPSPGPGPRTTAIHDGLMESGDELLSFDYMDLDYKETVRNNRANRKPYSYKAWIDHRSDDRYSRYMATLGSSEVLRGVLKPALFFTAASIMFGLYFSLYDLKVLPSWIPYVRFSPEVFTLTAPVLSFLLVFRTNASYNRWEEGRVELAEIVKSTRELTRMGLTHIEDEQLREALLRWIQAFVWALKCHVRPGEIPDLDLRLGGVLQPEEYNRLDEAEHKPQHALVMLTRIIRLANLAPPLTAMLNAPLSNLQNIVAATERNLRLPMFIPYTQNILRFLLGWIMFLPLALFPKMGWYSVPAVTAISALLLGIEELGTQIEEPYSILPVEGMAAQVTANVKEMAQEFMLKGSIFEWEARAVEAAEKRARIPFQ